MLKLNHDNYFSIEANLEYMSASQIKAFETCEASALEEVKTGMESEREAFKEGKFFEASICGREDLFIMQNPDMVSSRGTTKGDLKANFKKVVGSIDEFKRHKIFMDIIDRCQQQVIVTGIIPCTRNDMTIDIPFKGAIDFLDMETLDFYDSKCMKDFNNVWSQADNMKIKWYFAYRYQYQCAIYRELILQTFGREAGKAHIMATTKEDIPDSTFFYFSKEILDNAIEIIEYDAPKYQQIKQGQIEPTRCEKCEYCRRTRIITEPYEITEADY